LDIYYQVKLFPVFKRILMKRKIPLSLMIAVLFSASFFTVTSAQDLTDPEIPDFTETYEGIPLCMPGVYLINPVDCLPMGPSMTLTSWARKGLTFPLRPLPAAHPDPSYTLLDKKYAKLNILPGTLASYYPNLEAAVAGSGALRSLPPGETLFITYENVAYYENKPFLRNARGEWIRASPATFSDFQGLLFKQQPVNDFGWVLDNISPRKEPSVNAAFSPASLAKRDVVQVFGSVEAEGMTWYMIQPDQWVEHLKIRVVSPMLEAPEGVDNGRWIEINLHEQTLSVYEESRLVFSTLTATGYDPYFTQPGLFQVREKKEFETMTGAFAAGKADYYMLEDVPWTIYYDGPRAMHGAYWHVNFGYEVSHGCVNLSIGDAHWLYEWVNEGDWVYVHDPSGRTPTDPEFYRGSAAF
jgi:hypothetical protein